MNDFESVVNFYGLKKPSTKFDQEDVVDLSKEIKHDIFLYNAEIEPIFNPIRKFDQIIHLVVENAQISLLANKKSLPKLLICKTSKNCIFQTTDSQRFQKHKQVCADISVQKIVTKQVFYGEKVYLIAEMIKTKILPPKARNYRQKYFATWEF